VSGIALATQVLHVVGMAATGKLVFRKRLTRPTLLPFLAPLPPIVIGMEAREARTMRPAASRNMAIHLR
jgi:hypothetical protein